MIIYSIYRRFNKLALTACHRYWRDDWYGAIRPDRPNSTGRRPWQFIHSFYHLVSSLSLCLCLFLFYFFIYRLWFCTSSYMSRWLGQSEAGLRVYKYKTKGYTICPASFISVNQGWILILLDYRCSVILCITVCKEFPERHFTLLCHQLPLLFRPGTKTHIQCYQLSLKW